MKWQCSNVFCAGSPTDGPTESGIAALGLRGVPRGKVPSMPNFGGEEKGPRDSSASSPLRKEQLKQHEELVAKQQARDRDRERRSAGAGAKALLQSPGGSISRGLEKERNVLGTPFEEAVVQRAVRDLVFGDRPEPPGPTDPERDLALAAAAAQAEEHQRLIQDLTAQDESNKKVMEQMSKQMAELAEGQKQRMKDFEGVIAELRQSKDDATRALTEAEEGNLEFHERVLDQAKKVSMMESHQSVTFTDGEDGSSVLSLQQGRVIHGMGDHTTAVWRDALGNCC